MVHHHHRLSPLTLVELPVFLTFGRELSAPSGNMSSSLTSSSSVSAPESSGEQSRSEKRCTWTRWRLQHNSARKHYDQFSILYVYMYMGSNITIFFTKQLYLYFRTLKTLIPKNCNAFAFDTTRQVSKQRHNVITRAAYAYV